MSCDYKKYPSNWKTEIRPAIMQRAKNRCEFCGVKHYSVGSWMVKNLFLQVETLPTMQQGMAN